MSVTRFHFINLPSLLLLSCGGLLLGTGFCSPLLDLPHGDTCYYRVFLRRDLSQTLHWGPDATASCSRWPRCLPDRPGQCRLSPAPPNPVAFCRMNSSPRETQAQGEGLACRWLTWGHLGGCFAWWYTWNCKFFVVFFFSFRFKYFYRHVLASPFAVSVLCVSTPVFGCSGVLLLFAFCFVTLPLTFPAR